MSVYWCAYHMLDNALRGWDRSIYPPDIGCRICRVEAEVDHELGLPGHFRRRDLLRFRNRSETAVTQPHKCKQAA
jgi:hypothetical protein